ncbi:hypothetical protein [Tropheryma whipplei]|uniref:hypothetical protein n=1 Tax=Tropheryma whipplei TaxID=2039 RepID=UPI0004AFFD9F|nr:hypothetical protein [Tropheryma whipplei]
MSLSQLPQEKRIIEKKELLKILMERALEVKEGLMKGGFLKKEFREKVPGGGVSSTSLAYPALGLLPAPALSVSGGVL